MDEQDVMDVGPHDAVVLQLQGLRRRAGEPSYAEIARWVGRLRTTRGVSESAATPPRTTVYDAFRLGRRRLDRELVADITEVLGEEVDRLTRARREVDPGAVPEPADASDDTATRGPTPEVPAQADVHEVGHAEVGAEVGHDEVDVHAEPPATPTGERAEAADAPALPAAQDGPSVRTRIRILLLAFVLNMVGQILATALDVPIWQDMTGTAIAAIALGPWWGALVAVLSMAGDVQMFQDTGYWFLPVSVAGALAWGYGVRRWRLARNPLTFLGLNVAVATLCTAIAVPITYWRFDGFTTHDSSRLTVALADALPWLVLAVFVSNLVYSLFDKLVSGFIALAVLDSLAVRRRWLYRRLRPRPAARDTASGRPAGVGGRR